MIEVEMNLALLIYLGSLLLFIFGIWLWHNFSSRKKKRSFAATELAVCEYCHFAYLAQTSAQVNKCPSCLCLNKDNWYTREKKIL